MGRLSLYPILRLTAWRAVRMLAAVTPDFRRNPMVDQATTRGLLAGGYDMHVHSGPDVLPRKFDDAGLAERTRESGMAGFVIKSHYVCTADRANLIRQIYPDVHAYGGIALNNAVGG